MKTSHPYLNLSRTWPETVFFLLLLVPRIIYIFLTNNSSGDSSFYNRIAENILAGCGFSASNSNENCEPLVGGYFPGYPLLWAAIKYINLDEKYLLYLVSIIFCLAILHLKSSIFCLTKNRKTAWFGAALVGFSPLSFGFARVIAIEPILAAISIFVLSALLRFLYFKRIKELSVTLLVIIIGSWFKPTAVIFAPPLVGALIYIYGIKKALKPIAWSIIILCIAIMPWELRNWQLSSKSLLLAESNSWIPINGYHTWLKSWTVDEYERGRASFPVWSGELGDVVIKSNKFLPESEAKDARDVIRDYAISNRIWDQTIDYWFRRAAEQRKETMSACDTISLRILQSFSLILHPGNSYGFPISFQSNVHDHQITLKFIYKKIKSEFAASLTKLLLFVYRVIIWMFFIYFLSKAFLSRILLPISSYHHRFSVRRGGCVFLMLAGFIICGSLTYHVFYFYALEHAYLISALPWLELSLVVCFAGSRSNSRLVHHEGKIEEH